MRYVVPAYVGFQGHKQTPRYHLGYVRFAPPSGHCLASLACPLSANRVLMRRSNLAPLFDHFIGELL
jgi:hypothetical protein